MDNCNLFVTREEFDQYANNFNTLIEKIDDLSSRIETIENRLENHINELICGDNAHGGLEKVNVVVELKNDQLTVYVSICDQVFEDSVSLEELFMGIDVKIDNLEINQQTIIDLTNNLLTKIEQISINQSTINNIENKITNLETYLINQITVTLNSIYQDLSQTYNYIISVDQNVLTLFQINDNTEVNQNNISILENLEQINLNQKSIELSINDLEVDFRQINNINRSINTILNNQSFHITLTRNSRDLIINNLDVLYNNIIIQYQQLISILNNIQFFDQNLIVNKIDNLLNVVTFQYQQLISLINNIKSYDDSILVSLTQTIVNTQQQILLIVSNLENYDDTNILNIISQVTLTLDVVINSINGISQDISKLNEIEDSYKLWDCELEEEINQPIDSLASGLYYLNSQLYDIQNKVCELEIDCGQLLPTDLAIWVNYGYYILFYWKWENKEVKTGLNFTQLPEPIDALINPIDINTVWDQYFQGIYRIIGEQFSFLHIDNVKTPIYRGWFLNNSEAIRFYNSIIPLTRLSIKQENNPAFPTYSNKQTNIKNTGERVLLRKVCIIEKLRNSDDINHIITYGPPK
ncbi:hypothetical protein [Cyanothece sp. BG0011]|uniref:hypothetical protein n=1 Tax=Cyanothece sp. BG0011 TaxID=2082950 RepID=UPI000D1E0242|nr:hypothetical protein [Cyanothece sp. BG0011]